MLSLNRLKISLCKKVLNCNVGFKLINATNQLSSTSFNFSQNHKEFGIQKQSWNHAVNEAENLLGYSKSFFSPQWIFMRWKELIQNNHELAIKFKNTFFDEHSNMLSWKLIILLLSKTVDDSTKILKVAEVTEMIRMAHLIHQKLINLQTLKQFGNELESDSELITNNKIGLLVGDFLLGNAMLQLAKLRNQDLFGLILSTVRDLNESNFIGDRDDENIALSSDPALKINLTDTKPLEEFDNTRDIDMSLILGHAEREWDFRHTLSSGKLLGKSCQGTLKLAGQSEELQKHGYTFGKHLALAYQASMDLEPFKLQELPLTSTFSLVSAPVLFHLDYDPTLYEEIKKGRKSVTNIDFRKIHKIVRDGPGIDETKELQRKHGQIAMDVLNEFPDCDARTALQNIILAME